MKQTNTRTRLDTLADTWRDSWPSIITLPVMITAGVYYATRHQPTTAVFAFACAMWILSTLCLSRMLGAERRRNERQDLTDTGNAIALAVALRSLTRRGDKLLVTLTDPDKPGYDAVVIPAVPSDATEIEQPQP